MEATIRSVPSSGYPNNLRGDGPSRDAQSPSQPASLVKRALVFAYGTFAYAAFLGVFLYAVGFLGNFGVPNSIDSAPRKPFAEALLINTLLLGLFAVQHSVMARRTFKHLLTRFIPQAAERSTYVLMSSVCLVLLFAFSEPMGGKIWDVQPTIARAVLYALYAR